MRTLRAAGANWQGSHRVASGGRFDGLGFSVLPAGSLLQPDTVVDVGANLGWWSRSILEMSAPKRLLALEPIPEMAHLCRERLGTHPTARVVEAACAATRGRAEFAVATAHQASSLLSPNADAAARNRGLTTDRRVEVEVVALDDIVDPSWRVRLLKIDVQGAELGVLQGATRTLRQTDYVLIEVNFTPEYVGGSTFPEVNEHLTERGFELIDMSRPMRIDGRAVSADAVYRPLAGQDVPPKVGHGVGA